MALPPQVRVDQPWKERHNTAATQQAIKTMLSNGTPDWVRFPEDYRAFVKESFAAEKEASDEQVREYKMEDQLILADAKPRMVNITSSKDFVLKLREHGIKCFALFCGLANTAGLWCIVPTKNGTDVRYITWLQTPAMVEWDVLRLDRHGLPNGLDYRGWRSVVCELIKKKILTEERAHEIFGRPTDSVVSRVYRRKLYEYRHRNEDIAPVDGFQSST